jgi:V/A-type H+-transporting ATPase subunit E
MSVDNIIAKITADSDIACAQIKAAAEKKAEDLKKRILREAEEVAKKIFDQAALDVEEIARRQSLIAELENRKNILAVRRKVLDDAFSLAGEKLGKLTEEKWEALVTRYILAGCETGGEKLCVPDADRARYQKGLLDRLNKQLLTNGKVGGVALSEKTADFSGGVLVIGSDGDYDASFSALLQNVRAEYEKEAADLLFPSEV